MSTILYPFGPWCDAEASGDTTLYAFGGWWEPVAAAGFFARRYYDNLLAGGA